LGCLNHAALVDGHGDMVDRGGVAEVVGVEQQVARTDFGGGQVVAAAVELAPLPGGDHALPVEAGVLPDQAGAVVGVGAFGAQLVGLAPLGERERHRPRCCRL
jgi:hypothetical protein